MNKYLQTNIPKVGTFGTVQFRSSKLDATKPDLKITGLWEATATEPAGQADLYIDYRFAVDMCAAGLIRQTGVNSKHEPTFQVIYPGQRVCFIKREVGGNKKETSIFAAGPDGQPVTLPAQPAPTWSPAAPTGAPAAPPAGAPPLMAPPVQGAPSAPVQAPPAGAPPVQAMHAGPGAPTDTRHAPAELTDEERAARSRREKIVMLETLGRGSETYLIATRAARRAVLDCLGLTVEEFLELPLADRVAIAAIVRPAADTNIIRLEKLGGQGYIGIARDINNLPAKYASLKEALTGVMQAPAPAPPPPPPTTEPGKPGEPFRAAAALEGKGAPRPAPQPEPAMAGGQAADGEELDDDLPF